MSQNVCLSWHFKPQYRIRQLSTFQPKPKIENVWKNPAASAGAAISGRERGRHTHAHTHTRAWPSLCNLGNENTPPRNLEKPWSEAKKGADGEEERASVRTRPFLKSNLPGAIYCGRVSGKRKRPEEKRDGITSRKLTVIWNVHSRELEFAAKLPPKVNDCFHHTHRA